MNLKPMIWVGVLGTIASVLAACGSNEADGTIEASGTIEATQVNVAAQVPGIITAVYVEEGAIVDSGAVLFQIRHDDLNIQREQAVARLQQARANLRQAVNGPQPEDFQQARAALRQSEVQRDAARTELRRVEPLAAAGTVPSKQLDDVRARVDAAEAAVDVARAQLARLEAGTRQEQIDAARAQVALAEAQIRQIEQKIEDCTVRSPVRATVTDRLMEPGEMANMGSVVITLTSLDPVWLQIYLTEVQIGMIRLGQPAQVYIDAAPDIGRTGFVQYVSPNAEFTPKNVQTKEDRVKLVFGVKIRVDNPDGLLKPGLPADTVIMPETWSNGSTR